MIPNPESLEAILMRASPLPKARKRRRHARAIVLAALALGTQTGCTREFFREWANQDASEAIFEKSRDPRWRIDLFSVDPPALARYADPYDPDVPPAPPDDYAAQATSPVPQWPDNRLIIPAEGTGYLDLLEAWHRGETVAGTGPAPPDEDDARPGAGPAPAPRAQPPAAATPRPVPSQPPPLPPQGQPSPFGPGRNSGPANGGMSPTNVPGSPPSSPPRRQTPAAPEARAKVRDTGVRLAAFQETGIPAPVPPPSNDSLNPPGTLPRDMPTPPIGMDPEPGDRDLSKPGTVRPDLTPEEYQASEAMGSEMAGILIPGEIEFDDAEAGGLPRNSRPYKLTIEQAFVLGLVNARVYQFNLEQVYLAALAVTLQRFAFQPQLYAGLSPLTGVAQKPAIGGTTGPSIAAFGAGAGQFGGGGLSGGSFAVGNPINQFNYATRATGRPASALNLGTVAGMGKVFSSGAQLLLGFANQVVFNFIGKDSRQPTVQSSLPITFIQPFLRGGGRAVTLEPLTQAERALLYQVRAFAKFRQEFVVATLVGGSFQVPGSTASTTGFTGGGNVDPVIGFLNVVQDIQQVENDKKNLAAYEQLYKVYAELIQGESSGLTQLQLDQIDSQIQGARQTLISDRTSYRGQLDALKVQLGMPPDVPMILDRSLTRRFKEVFDAIDEWQRDPKRKLEDLPGIVAKLPDLEDVVIDGRSVLAVYKKATDNEDDLEEVLLAAERVALEHRLDMMNARAELYDNWRQIRVAANALKGILNVQLTNQIVTPPTTTNPFAFLSQAKQFSLVLNAELPLVRLAERNNFRATLINYQRQRRNLQVAEDNLKISLRNDVRGLQTAYLTYEIFRRNLVLTIRQKDQAFEQIIAPPQGAAGGGGGTAQAGLAATQTSNLIQFQGQLLRLENTLLSTWLSYETGRLGLYRDLGTLPYDEWEAYRELFPPERIRAGGGGIDSVRGPGAARTATSEPRQTVRR